MELFIDSSRPVSDASKEKSNVMSSLNAEIALERGWSA